MSYKKYLKVLPVLTLLGGLTLAGFMFYNIIISPILNADAFNVNEAYSVTVTDDYVITVFIDEENVEDIYIEDYTNFKRLTYTINGFDYSVLLNVLSESEDSDTFLVTSTNETTSYNVQNLKSVFQIHLKEPGTYHFGLISYEDQKTEFMMVNTDVPEAKSELYTSITIGSISFIGSLVSLYFLVKNPKKDA